MRAGLFFYAHGGELFPSLGDDQLGILLDQPLELGMTGQGLFQQGDLLGADVTGEVSALLPGLQFEVGRGGDGAVAEGGGRVCPAP